MTQLGSYPVSFEVPVAWGDMDALAHVNNTVYLRWFESGRMAYFSALGMDRQMTERSVGPILARTSCNFRLAVTYPDTVRVEASITALGNTSFTMGYRVKSQKHGWQVAADGDGVVVMLNYTEGGKVPVTDELRARIEAFEGSHPAS